MVKIYRSPCIFLFCVVISSYARREWFSQVSLRSRRFALEDRSQRPWCSNRACDASQSPCVRLSHSASRCIVDKSRQRKTNEKRRERETPILIFVFVSCPFPFLSFFCLVPDRRRVYWRWLSAQRSRGAFLRAETLGAVLIDLFMLPVHLARRTVFTVLRFYRLLNAGRFS